MAGPSKVSETEALAQRVIEAALGCTLDKLPERSIPTADFRSPDGQHGVEVKELNNGEFRALTAAWQRRQTSLDLPELTGRWTVMLDLPTLPAALPAPRKFVEPDPALAAALTDAGMHVVTKAEHEAADAARRAAPAPEPVRLAGLLQDLGPHLAVLEAHKITNTRDASFEDQEVRVALGSIARRTRNAICMAHPPVGEQEPGIDIALSHGDVRTGRADDVVGRIAVWLGSDGSRNLKDSLANEPAGARRHAALVFYAATEPEHQSAIEQGASFCPTAPVELPPEIDDLWFVLGPVACWFNPEDQWRSALVDQPRPE